MSIIFVSSTRCNIVYTSSLFNQLLAIRLQYQIQRRQRMQHNQQAGYSRQLEGTPAGYQWSR